MVMSGARRSDPRLDPKTEIYLALHRPLERLPMATDFRTTWLASSLAALRNRGLLEQYTQHLAEEYHDVVLHSVAGQWAPIEVADAHYAACDALNLPVEELSKIGAEVTQRVHGSILSTFVKLAKQSGVSPWTVLGQLDRLWDKIWVGGGVRVYRTGRKDALVEIVRWPLAGKRYLRETMPSVIQAIMLLFCRKAYAHLESGLSNRDTLCVSASWV